VAPTARSPAFGGPQPRAGRGLALRGDEADGHKTENVYRRYAIVAESDLREAGAKLAATLGAALGSFSDNSGDNSVTARKG
jgi:hypothetical protein